MMNRQRLKLTVNTLETRDVPATFGVPWADPLHLTASFAPDGTSTGGDTSGLDALLQTQGLSANGKLEILRAMQTWIANANINVGLAYDSGLAFGTAGAVQRHASFGDIRVGTLAMNGNQLAETQPYDAIAGTWAGDVLLNENSAFSIGAAAGQYDLYSVFLQEFGHSLGVANSPNAADVMYDVYQGVRAGLSSGDIAAIQALYGTRQHDAFDKQSRNESFGSATPIALATPLLQLPGAGAVLADITTASDADFYKFTSLRLGWTTITVKANGYSLLAPKLDVYSAFQQRLGGAMTTDPLNNTVTFRFFASLGSTYYLRVGAGSTTFSVGAYELDVVPDGLQLSVPSTDLNSIPEPLGILNNTFITASDMGLTQLLTGADRRYDYAATAAIDYAGDVDYFRFSVPNQVAADHVLNVSVWQLGSTVQPRVTVYDALGRTVESEIIINENGSYGVQVAQAWQTGATYYVKVGNQANTTGKFFLGVDFNKSYANLVTVADSVQLDDVNRYADGSLTLVENQLLHFVLAGQASANNGVQVIFYTTTGTVLKTLTVWGNDTLTDTLWLQAGTYNIAFEAVSRNGAPLTTALFSFKLKDLSDSIDPYETDPNAPKATATANPSGSSTTTTKTYTATQNPPKSSPQRY